MSAVMDSQVPVPRSPLWRSAALLAILVWWIGSKVGKRNVDIPT